MRIRKQNGKWHRNTGEGVGVVMEQIYLLTLSEVDVEKDYPSVEKDYFNFKKSGIWRGGEPSLKSS